MKACFLCIGQSDLQPSISGCRCHNKRKQQMRCYCCDRKIALARKVKLRPFRDFDPRQGGPNSAAYQSYLKDLTFRWAFVCQVCYAILDNRTGAAEIETRVFNIAGVSRGDKAPVVDEAKYQAFQRREAGKMGLEI
jgi:hypothetical protein